MTLAPEENALPRTDHTTEDRMNPSHAHHDVRIEQLLTTMTRAEKLAQLQIRYHPDPEEAKKLVRAGIGCVFWAGSAEATNELQRIATEESAHGIPLLVGLDVIHGHRTIFPIPLAEASSFDPTVAEEDARVSATEARSAGINLTFSPMIDVSRDPRWGRVAEGFGEDVLLTSVFGRAKVRGYQGSDLAADDAIAACAKHFVAYGDAEGGRDYNTVDVSEHRLRNVCLEPFRAAVGEGVAAVMASLNTVAGVPMHANRRLLTDVLKGEWGFPGTVIGDADAVPNLIAHGVAEELRDALAAALGAGLDIEMGGNVVSSDGTSALRDEDLAEARVDDAVRRVLLVKARLGLFDDPYVPAGGEHTAPTARSRSAARHAAERSIVLLKNDGTLPLASPAGRVLVTGPYADSTDHSGAWVMSFGEETRDTIASALSAADAGLTVTTLPGATFYGDDPRLQDAVRSAAPAHDVVVVAVGEPSDLSGEASSRSDLRLPGDQERLIRTVAETGVPFAVVLMTGRPLVTAGWVDSAPAVLLAWHLGTEAPAAIARTLLGAVNPAGRLPMAFPRSSGQVPIYYAHESTGRPARTGGVLNQDAIDIGVVGPNNVDDRYTSKYRDLPLGPQFRFGDGLSYTRFAYGETTIAHRSISRADLSAGSRFELTVRVANVGPVDGDEVVQLYTRDVVASVAPLVRRLGAFQRVHIPAGAARDVTLTVGHEELGFWTTNGAPSFDVEPGAFEVFIGGHITDEPVAVLTVS